MVKSKIKNNGPISVIKVFRTKKTNKFNKIFNKPVESDVNVDNTGNRHNFEIGSLETIQSEYFQENKAHKTATHATIEKSNTDHLEYSGLSIGKTNFSTIPLEYPEVSKTSNIVVTIDDNISNRRNIFSRGAINTRNCDVLDNVNKGRAKNYDPIDIYKSKPISRLTNVKNVKINLPTEFDDLEVSDKTNYLNQISEFPKSTSSQFTFESVISNLRNVFSKGSINCNHHEVIDKTNDLEHFNKGVNRNYDTVEIDKLNPSARLTNIKNARIILSTEFNDFEVVEKTKYIENMNKNSTSNYVALEHEKSKPRSRRRKIENDEMYVPAVPAADIPATSRQEAEYHDTNENNKLEAYTYHKIKANTIELENFGSSAIIIRNNARLATQPAAAEVVRTRNMHPFLIAYLRCLIPATFLMGFCVTFLCLFQVLLPEKLEGILDKLSTSQETSI